MEKLFINGIEYQFLGEPLEAFTYDGELWGGRSNFLQDSESNKTKADLLNIQDCFVWMNKWSLEEDYICGYILDFSKKIVYYDTDEAYFHLFKRTFPKLKMENYFTQFVKRDFTE